MRILIDMNLSPRWADILSLQSIEALHWLSVGSASASDAEIIAYAKDNDFAVFTHDLDFSTMLAITNGEKPSVIQIRTGDVSPTTAAPQILNALMAASNEIEKGALLTVDMKKQRLRLLPLACR